MAANATYKPDFIGADQGAERVRHVHHGFDDARAGARSGREIFGRAPIPPVAPLLPGKLVILRRLAAKRRGADGFPPALTRHLCGRIAPCAMRECPILAELIRNEVATGLRSCPDMAGRAIT